MTDAAKSDALPNGRDICDAILHTLESNMFELPRRTIVPSAFYVKLHPESHSRVKALIPYIQEDALKELNLRLGQLNAKKLGRAQRRYERAGAEWKVEILEDSDGEMEPADIEVHPLFTSTPDGEPIEGTATSVLKGPIRARPPIGGTTSPGTSRAPMATLTYRDATGEQRYGVVNDEVTIGRGGGSAPDRVGLETTDTLSRKHCVIRRNGGGFEIEDSSTNGTSVNGKRLSRGTPAPLPDGAKIDLGGVIKINFRLEKDG